MGDSEKPNYYVGQEKTFRITGPRSTGKRITLGRKNSQKSPINREGGERDWGRARLRKATTFGAKIGKEVGSKKSPTTLPLVLGEKKGRNGAKGRPTKFAKGTGNIGSPGKNHKGINEEGKIWNKREVGPKIQRDWSMGGKLKSSKTHPKT